MIWGTVLRRCVLPLGDGLLGHPMMNRLKFLEQAQWWKPDQIQRYRIQKLREVCSVAFNEVPLYRELSRRSGVDAARIKGAEDLLGLPVVTKTMLRGQYPERVTRKVPGTVYETSTSGSTGTNFRVMEDHDTAAWYRATFLLALEWAGWKFGEPHLQIGMTLQRNLERRLKDALMRCHYVSGYDLSDAALDRCLDVLDRKRLSHLWGYPGSLHCLARRARQVGWNTPLKSVVTWGDQLHPPYRKLIEEVFKVPVSDTYGCGEGMQIAAQCEYGHYHIHELDVIVEFLDDDGNPVPPGTPGRIVLTRLHAGPMPFIRYEVGDQGVLSNQGACRCGRHLQRLEKIQGRTAEYVLTPSGNRLIVHFFTGILEHFAEIDSFQVVQDEVERITVRILPTAQYTSGASGRIIKALQEKGADLEINLEVVTRLPLTKGGKRQFIINNLTKPSAIATHG